MTVYVDNMLRPARIGRHLAKWSHLLADDPFELREFASRLGLRAEWIQHPGTHREHFDVTATVRLAALEAGAVPITYPHGTAEVLARRRAAITAALGGQP